MSVLKYKDPVTGEWKTAASVKLVEKVGKDEVYPFADVPDYVKEEAEAVAKAVRSVQTGKTLTFAAMADTHIGMALTSSNAVKTRESAEMAGQGLAYLRNILPVHTAFVLGDLTWSDGAYAVQQVKDDWNGTVKRLSVGFGGLPSAWTAGNHEINYGIGRERSMTEDEIYGYIGKESSGLTRDSAYPQKCYGYMDFPIQKIRVIVLNTADTLSEYPESDPAIKAKSEWVGAVQLQWLADTALDFSDKENAAEWGIVICSHHPIAYGGQSGIGRSLQILEAYRDGSKGSITYTSDTAHTVSYDFTSGEKAEIICNIHGHSHNFVYRKRSSTSSTDGNVEPWLWSFCIPCINCGRENEQATNEYLKDNYGDFDASGNPVYYYKTSGTREGTSFCVITIDREAKMVYAHKFGAGVDRSVYYGGEDVVIYSVTSSLGHCTISNTTSSIIGGKAYSAVITPAVGYELDSISVTMGGQTVATVNNLDGTVSIEIDSVTGDIVITAACVKKLVYPPTSSAWTNRVLEAKTTAGGTEIYNTVGYMDGKYLSGNSYGDDSATTATGYIAYPATATSAPVIYIKGITMDVNANSHCRAFFTHSDGNTNTSNLFSGSATMNTYCTIETLGEKYYKITMLKDSSGKVVMFNVQGVPVAFRVSGVGSGEDLIVTLDEPIEETNGGDEDVTVPVSTVLTHCNIDNSAKTVAYGSSYRAVITPYDGYVIGSLSVTMGSVDITSTAVSGSTIYIESVTGKVDIVAVGAPNTASYTNWLDADKAGYTNGYRLNSSGAEAQESNYTLSGYIPCKVGDVVRFAGITGLNASESDKNNHRVSFYDASKAHLRQVNMGMLGDITAAAYPYYNAELDADGDVVAFTVPSADNTTDLSSVAYLRFCTVNGGITAASVVTVNEVIE